ncbi:MAG: PKD domain-containing protein, partial [Gammaproteobacteria bacterium]
SVLDVPVVIGMIYTCTATAIPTGNCSDFRQAVVNVIETPEITQITAFPDTVVCALDPLIICGQNSVPDIDFDYTWTTPNGTIISGTASGDEVFCDTLSPAGAYGSGTYTLVVSNQGCTDMATIDVEVIQVPQCGPIMGDTLFCEGDSTTLWFWNTNDLLDTLIAICILPDSTVVMDTIFTNDTIYVTTELTGNFCCYFTTIEGGCASNMQCVILEALVVPVPIVTLDTLELCDGETLQLTGSTAAIVTDTITYTWTGPGGFIFTGTAPASGPFPATDTNPQSGAYCLQLSVTEDSVTCYSDSVCVEVIVHPTPVIDGIDGGGEFCENQDVTLTATVTIADGSDMSYEWTLNGMTIDTGTVASGETLTLAASAAGEYCLIVTSDFGCADTACTNVSFLTAPDLLEVTGGGEYCEGESVELSGMGTPGPGTVTYTWT